MHILKLVHHRARLQSCPTVLVALLPGFVKACISPFLKLMSDFQAFFNRPRRCSLLRLDFPLSPVANCLDLLQKGARFQIRFTILLTLRLNFRHNMTSASAKFTQQLHAFLDRNRRFVQIEVALSRIPVTQFGCLPLLLAVLPSVLEERVHLIICSSLLRHLLL